MTPLSESKMSQLHATLGVLELVTWKWKADVTGENAEVNSGRE